VQLDCDGFVAECFRGGWGANLSARCDPYTTRRVQQCHAAHSWYTCTGSRGGGGKRPTWRWYGDEKVANRDTKVWHGATENVP
jgi:hypothetical protein